MSKHTFCSFLALGVTLIGLSCILAACNFSSKDDENSPDPQLTIQALEFQLTAQAQGAQITALAQTIAAPQQPQTPIQPVETSVAPPQPSGSSKPTIKVNTDAPCLQAQADGAYTLDVIPAGQTATILYDKVQDLETKAKYWWLVESPKGCWCWVSEENIESITGDVSGLEVYNLVGLCPP
jgi:hypothetical protein